MIHLETQFESPPKLARPKLYTVLHWVQVCVLCVDAKRPRRALRSRPKCNQLRENDGAR